VANPISSESLVEMLESQFSEPIHSVCLTGGEPLCQADFLKEFIPLLKSHGLTVFLETNGTLPHELEKVVDTIDIIAADIKLPSISKQAIDFSKVEEFLKLASRKKVFVKIVVSSLIDIKEFNEAIDLIHRISADIPLVIQPISAKEKAAGAVLLSLQEQALKKLKNVFIIPQIHKLLGFK
jgi:organic radical activating enzyme